jgi:hypothetical protein
LHSFGIAEDGRTYQARMLMAAPEAQEQQTGTWWEEKGETTSRDSAVFAISSNNPRHETFSLFSKRRFDWHFWQSNLLFSVSAPVFPASLRS